MRVLCQAPPPSNSTDRNAQNSVARVLRTQRSCAKLLKSVHDSIKCLEASKALLARPK
jgi:hypothetical protein